MEGNYFEQLGREILQQKRRMDKLEEENRELRRQLTELRAGWGIFLKIGDRRIALITNGQEATPENASTPSQPSDGENTSIRITSNTPPLVENGETEETLTQASAEKASAAVEASKVNEVTFLEEVMLDELASALTGPVPTISKTEGEQKNVIEGQQEHLRRELQGSYILE
jgi:hypothetical protein